MTYKLVHATMDDLPEMIEHAKTFSKFLGNETVKFDMNTAVAVMSQVIQFGFCPLVKKDDKVVGGLGAAIHPSLWNMNQLQITELFWWVGEEHRHTRVGAMLLKYFVTEAKKAGLNPVLHTLEHSPVNEETLKRYGFHKKESTFYFLGV